MTHKKDKNPYNDKGQPHGLWVRYNQFDIINYKCTFNNGKYVGYREYKQWSINKKNEFVFSGDIQKIYYIR